MVPHFGRTEVRSGVSKTTNCEESGSQVRLPVGPPRIHKNSENNSDSDNNPRTITFFWHRTVKLWESSETLVPKKWCQSKLCLGSTLGSFSLYKLLKDLPWGGQKSTKFSILTSLTFLLQYTIGRFQIELTRL